MKYIKNVVSREALDLGALAERSRPAGSKKEVREKLTNADADWVLYSMVEGQDPNTRASQNNPAARLLGFIADFEPNTPGKDCFDLGKLDRIKDWIRPTKAFPSQSGGLHIVWEFDEPIQVDDHTVKPALQAIGQELGVLKKKGSGEKGSKFPHMHLDANAAGDPYKFYTWSGRAPIPLGEPIESARFSLKIWEEIIQPREPVLRIPLHIAYENLCEKYPEIKGREWTIGERTNTFWDGGNNPTAAILDADGIYSFKDNQFFPWSHESLLGEAKVKELGEGATVSILEETYFDGNRFWFQGENGLWQDSSESMFRNRLSHYYGVANRAEQSAIMETLDRTKRIDGGAPFVHQAAGLHQVQGKTVLNTSTIKPLPMAEGDPSVITDYLRDLLLEREQYEWFCCWLASGYRAVINRQVQQGPLLALAGPPGVGKTYVANRIFGALFGGFCDATDILFNQSRFNSHAMTFYSWVADDPPPQNYKNQGAVENVLKRFVANRVHHFEAKGQPAVSVLWAGRILITCNLDAASTFALPSLDQSNKDKVAFLKMRTPKNGIPTETDLKAALPAFAKYLYDLEIPEKWRDIRFGVKAFHHPDVLETSETNSQSSLALEFLRVFLPEYMEDGKEIFRATASQMVTMARSSLSESSVLLPSQWGARWLGVRLSELMDKNFPIERTRSKGLTYWHIDRKILDGDVSTSKTLDTDVTKINP